MMQSSLSNGTKSKVMLAGDAEKNLKTFIHVWAEDGEIDCSLLLPRALCVY